MASNELSSLVGKTISKIVEDKAHDELSFKFTDGTVCEFFQDELYGVDTEVTPPTGPAKG